MSDSEAYDFIVLGGGSAGIVAGVVASGLGARTLLIEKERIGGECSWTGCVPSKALLHAAQVAHQMRTAHEVGLSACEISREQAAGALAHVRAMMQRVSQADDSIGLLRQTGAEVAFGSPSFFSPDEIELNGRRLKAKDFLIATGSHPAVPDIPGLSEVGFLTNRTVFDLETVPEALVVLGGGPVGVELAQAFARLGSAVTIVQSGPRLLPRDDRELTDRLTDYLRAEGIEIRLNAQVRKIGQRDGKKTLEIEGEGTSAGEAALLRSEIIADEILVATGRAPNVEGLGLERAGVRLEDDGIFVDGKLHTSGPHVWACGDVIGRYQFSHIAEYEAKLVVRNAFFPMDQKADFRLIPWATFTDPELAHIGLTEEEAKAQGLQYEVFRHEFDHDDRALVENSGKGVVKILATGFTGKILGAHILGPRAGELLHEFILAMEHGLTLRHLADMIHVYPTLNVAIQRASQRWYQHQSERPLVKSLLETYFRVFR